MTVPTNKFSDEQIREARTRLWYLGNLEWKLDFAQKEVYERWKQIKVKTSVLNISRRVGKTYFLAVLAVQQCLQKPKSIVKFLQPEQKMIRVNLRPIMDKIFLDCPDELRPEFKTMDNIYRFKNGSEIQLAGTDAGNAEKLRGGDAELCLIDEAAFVQTDLKYLIRSILLPSTILTRGKIILSSSSPTDSNHDFAKYMEDAELNNTLIRITLFDALKIHKTMHNPRFTEELVQEIMAEYPGGITNDDFRRECMCIVPSNGDNSIIPEFNSETEQDLVAEWRRPPFCDKYVSMDIGFKDLTVVLFGYWDFENAVLVIEDEIKMNGPQMTTDKLAEEIRKKEVDLWTNKLTNETEKPYRRISDNNPIVLNDLNRLHGLTFFPTAKDNKEMAINQVRMMVQSHQIVINPRCKTLISHMRNGTWNKKRDNFSRSGDTGHYDALDGIIYLVRNLDKSHNPFPLGYRYSHLSKEGYFLNPSADQNPKHTTLKKMFGFKKKGSSFNK
jgi:hypothetical protein